MEVVTACSSCSCPLLQPATSLSRTAGSPTRKWRCVCTRFWNSCWVNHRWWHSGSCWSRPWSSSQQKATRGCGDPRGLDLLPLPNQLGLVGPSRWQTGQIQQTWWWNSASHLVWDEGCLQSWLYAAPGCHKMRNNLSFTITQSYIQKWIHVAFIHIYLWLYNILLCTNWMALIDYNFFEGFWICFFLSFWTSNKQIFIFLLGVYVIEQ